MQLFDDWLTGTMEHQDIDLNHKAVENGALPADLARLYRGQYAAMLISLSLHKIGHRKRPEVLVYDAICSSEQKERAPWTFVPHVLKRRAQELEQYGELVNALVKAVV